ncbi:MAG: shikimate dehydrogenase [Flavobacteriaceae bacterium]|nr:shikimate dehydrogenase [Flavobacteriaceae bacterium]|tara:strand:+ start:765 stop:1511 length:747 start_codon:yes stop_codon:yes gene_type:complete
MDQEKKTYGLLGKNIDYSFSKSYFLNKFKKLNLDSNYTYKNLDLNDLNQFRNIIEKKEFNGFNVTIPFKEKIIKFLDLLDSKAKKIGAVNTIKICSNYKLKGYNTDYIGFIKSIRPFLNKNHKKAILLGSGGASKSIVFGLNKLNISSIIVSRFKKKGDITYKELNSEIINKSQIIINCSPIGTFPKINECPKIPYNSINSNHICYDLVYNPIETEFLMKSKKNDAKILNGMKMLELQAEESWKIWNE